VISFAVVIGIVVFLILIETPVPFAFGAGAFAFALLAGRDISFLVPHAFQGLSSFALLALPLFITGGALMSRAGISNRLLQVVEAAIGGVRGGLGAVLVVVCALFGAISGSANAAIAAIGPIMIPRMLENGYPRDYVIGLISVSAILAMLIPPSIPMIIFAITANLSVAACFLSTLIPGVLLTALYVSINLVWSRRFLSKEGGDSVSLLVRGRRTWSASRRAFLALLLPVIVFGGIYGGVFTPTEAAAVAFSYSLAVGLVIYRALDREGIVQALSSGAVLVGAGVMVLFFLLMLSRALTLDRIPFQIAEGLLSISDNPVVILIFVNLILLGIGMIMDDISGVLLAAIILLPIVTGIGVDPIHFAAIVGVNLGMGNITPPCAPLLFLAGKVGECEPHEYMKTSVILILLGHLPMVFVVTFFPDIALWLPRILMGT